MLSGGLLILCFYPFYLWPLCFVALVPLCFAALRPTARTRDLFLAGGIAVGMLAFTVSFFLVVQFNWLPASPFFVDAIRYGGIVTATLGYGALFGLWLAAYARLRSQSPILNALVGASLYAMCERIAEFSVGGYYLGAFSHAVTPLPLLMSFAALGGASLVSLIVVLCNTYIAEILLLPAERRLRAVYAGGALVATLALLSAANSLYMASGQHVKDFSVAVVQVSSPSEKNFASVSADGALSFPWLAQTLSEAAQGKPDLLIYPDSPVAGIVARDTTLPAVDNAWVVATEAQLKKWIGEHAPKSAALMTWENVLSGGAITTQFQFWQNGALAGEVVKHALLPFMDYEPTWARKADLYSMPFDVISGPPNAAPVAVGGVFVGGLVCSEVHRETRGREEAASAGILIAAGSEAMFQDDITSLFSLRAAQYRAVENNVPVVRASLLGPSAIIDRTGRVVAYMPLGTGGILRGSVDIAPGVRTLFNQWGSVPFWICALLSVIAALYLKTIPPGKKE